MALYIFWIVLNTLSMIPSLDCQSRIGGHFDMIVSSVQILSDSIPNMPPHPEGIRHVYTINGVTIAVARTSCNVPLRQPRIFPVVYDLLTHRLFSPSY